MSSSRFAVVPTVWVMHPDLTPTDKLVLLSLATFANGDRRCWPSVRTIAERAGLKERAVQYALQHLRETGAVQVIPRVKDSGEPDTNVYWIVGYDLTLEEVMHGDAGGGARSRTTSCTTVHPNRTSNRTTEQATTTTAEPVAFPTPAMQDAYLSYREPLRNHRAFDASLLAIRDGMTTGKPVPLEVIGLALMDMAANGEGFNVSRLRGYLRKHEAATQAGVPRRANGTVDWDQITKELEAEYAAKGGA